MEFDNKGADSSAPNGVTSANSPTANANDDLTKNIKAEMNRKFSKINERLDKVLNHIEAGQTSRSAENADIEESGDVKKYIDSRFQAEQARETRTRHEKDYQEAVNQFPELDPNHESYDEKFYQLVDKLYTKRAKDNDPESLKEAVEIAAVRLGKIERLTQDKILKDEARRSRMISEGGTASRENKKAESSANLNLENLARMGIKNTDRLKERAKIYQKRMKGDE